MQEDCRVMNCIQCSKGVNTPFADLHRPQGFQEVCQAASLAPSLLSSFQVFPPLPSLALWKQHAQLEMQRVCLCTAFPQYLTYGSSSEVCKHQILVRPCPLPPRWPGHKADLAIWSCSGHCSSCPHWNTKTKMVYCSVNCILDRSTLNMTLYFLKANESLVSLQCFYFRKWHIWG